jgi:hypothetical protein
VIERQTKWILFERLPQIAKQKTRRWIVKTRAGVSLGEIRWFTAWRQYAFFPADSTVFERGCLRDIATFCEEYTPMRIRLTAKAKAEA